MKKIIRKRSWQILFATIITTLGVATLVSAITSAPTTYIADNDITLDGDLSDWPVESQVINEDGVSDITPSIQWCWSGSAWVETDSQANCVNSFYYVEEGQLDLQTGYFGTNETNMLLGFESAVPMMSVLNTTTDTYMSVFEMVQSSGITTLPQAFDHEMVFSFDQNPVTGEESYDYYFVAEIFIPEDLTSLMGNSPAADEDQQGQDVALKIYQEFNGTIGYQTDEETLLGTMDTSESESNGMGEGDVTAVMEIKQNIERFFELTGLSYDEEVQFRIETHSDIGDVSDPVFVSFAEGDVLAAPTNPTISALKKRKATLSWDAVTGATYYKAQLSKKNGKKLKTFKNVKKTSVKLDKAQLNKGRIYKARVRACDTSMCSDWSEYVRFTTKGTK